MSKNEMSEIMDQLFYQAKMQFGNAIKSQWFYDGEGCPGCGRKIDAFKFKKEKALSLNAYIYRDHGVLIGYLLCGKCARYIVQESKKDPITPTPLHAEIEKNLKKAYVRNLGH
jgi:hypothetical protein